MTIGELKIGSPLQFGMITPYRNGEGYEPHDIMWNKASCDGDFITSLSEAYLVFDAPERENPNQHRVSNGNSCYSQSNIHQYLNATGFEWYTPAHDFDSPPNRRNSTTTYVDKAGFLSLFEKWEVDMLIPREIVCMVPSGSKKMLGDSVTITCRVALPSASELGIDTGCKEGDMLEIFKTSGVGSNLSNYVMEYIQRIIPNIFITSGYWTRTAKLSSDCAVYNVRGNGQVESETPKMPRGIRPIIRLPLDCEIFINQSGVYEVVPPEDVCIPDDDFMNVLYAK